MSTHVAAGGSTSTRTVDLVVAEWRVRLTEASSAAEITSDHPRPATIGPRRHSSRLALADLAAFDGADLDDVLAAAWLLVVARASSQPSLVVAERDGDRSKGFLLDIDLADSDSFRSLTSTVAAHRRRERERGPITFVELVDALGLAHYTDRNPLCSTAIGPIDDDLEMPVTVPAPDIEMRWSLDAPDGVEVEISGAADLFRHQRVDHLAGQYETLLRSGLTMPDVPLADLNWLPALELELISGWQGRAIASGDTQLGRRFSDAARSIPDQIAVTSDDRFWTYRELDVWSNRLATHLRSLGVGFDDVVAIRMDRSLELVGSILAVLKSGAAYLSVDPTYPKSRQQFLLGDADVAVVLNRSDVDDPAAMHDAPTIVVDDPDAEFLRASDEAVEALGDGSELGYVIYTSGSTGAPKAVALPQRALANLMDWQLARPGFATGRRTLQYSSPSFDVSFQEILSTLLSAGTLVLIDDTLRRDPRSLFEHIVEHDVERIFLPNVALRGLAEIAQSNPSAARRLALREVYTAGEQLRVDAAMRSLFGELSDCHLENQYGPSETHVCTAHRLGDDPSRWPTLPPIGSPIANSWVEVLDDRGHRCPIGVPGELWVGGACLARGYLNNAEATNTRFRPDPFRPGQTLYRTGDRVRWIETGDLEFIGRLDDQVKFRGFRIEPGEIASVLSGADGVEQCFVAVRDVGGTGARLVAFVKFADRSRSMAELRRLAGDQLPDYMVPSHFVEVPALPLTASGKVDASALPDAHFDRSSLETEYVAASTPTETAILEMWQALLGTDHIGTADDFFELGGDSLMAVELFAMLHARFGVDLPLGSLAADPTIVALAGEVVRAGDGVDEFSVIVPIKTGGARRALFCVHGGSGNVASFPRLARLLSDDQPFYGLQWPGLGSARFPRSMDSLAVSYIDEIKSVQPNGPYLLAGQCIGGLIAQEVARQLTEAGDAVDLLVMYDSPMLYSPAYRPSGSVPPLPTAIRKPVWRVLSRAVAMMRFAQGSQPRNETARIRVRSALRLPQAMADRLDHASAVMCAMAWRHEPPVVAVTTVLIHSGEDNAGNMALTGRWTDGTLGWEHRLGPLFTAHEVAGGHNDLLYCPEAVAALRGLLDDRA